MSWLSSTIRLASWIPVVLVACHPTVTRARNAAREARYPDTIAELQRLEPQLERHRARWQAQYALERGLAHLAVGDVCRALEWLGCAWAWYELDPHLLTPVESRRLASAWLAMGLLPGARPDDLQALPTPDESSPAGDDAVDVDDLVPGALVPVIVDKETIGRDDPDDGRVVDRAPPAHPHPVTDPVGRLRRR